MEQAKTKPEESKEKIPESLPESLSAIRAEELLTLNSEIYNNLNSFYKTEIFKDVDFQDKRVAVGNLNDEFDESAYVKAGFFQKFDNFTRFGLHKKHYGLLKSKERGLLDKTELNENIEGKNIEIAQDNKKEREYIESNVIDIRSDFKKEKSERIVTKRFEKIDGKIVKMVESKRTKEGEIEAAGKLKNKKISEADVFGSDLVKLKEQFKKHIDDKSKLENLKYLSTEGKEELQAKMSEEEKKLSNSIKEKEVELKDKLSIFKEPLEERYEQTNELLNKVSLVFENAKNIENDFREKLRGIDNEIKLIESSGILAESKKDIIEELKLNREESARILSNSVELKTNMEARLKVLTVNKKELTDELFKINKIGKTKEEIEKEEKVKKEKETIKKETVVKKDRTEDFAEDWSFMEGQKISEETKIKPEQAKEEADVFYDLNDDEDKIEINEIIGSYLTKKDSQKKKDKGWFDGFIKNVFSSLFDLKKANVPINKKSIFKETDKIFKKSQKSQNKSNK